MQPSTMTQYYVLAFVLMGALVAAKPTTPSSKQTQEVLLPAPDYEDGDLKLVGKIEPPSEEDGELLDTANTMVFRPLFAYRRIQAQRRRVYAPRRRNGYGSYGYYRGSYDRFPTLA